MLKFYLKLSNSYICLILALILFFFIDYFFTWDGEIILHLSSVVDTVSDEIIKEEFIDEVVKGELIIDEMASVLLDETDVVIEELQEESYFQKIKNWTYNNRYYILVGTLLVGTGILLYYYNKQPPIPSDGLSPEDLEKLNKKLEFDRIMKESYEALEETREMRKELELADMYRRCAEFVMNEKDNMSQRVRMEKSGFYSMSQDRIREVLVTGKKE